MLIYDSNFILTLIQAKYSGGMMGFTSSGGVIMALPIAHKIAIFHPNLEDIFKKTIKDTAEKKGIEVLFLDKLNFYDCSEEHVEGYRKELARYLMSHGLSTSRISISGLFVYVELLKAKSKDPEVKELSMYIASNEYINNMLVVCKDTTITTEMITGMSMDDLKKKLRDLDTVEDFLSQFGNPEA